jgi:acetyl-CoA carboxylase biotin carboxyl carrier protein
MHTAQVKKEWFAMADITAHIAGTIFKIEKRVGDRVAAGDEVIILESMKMEIPLESPIAGVVQQILVTEGQAVEEGALVAIVA